MKTTLRYVVVSATLASLAFTARAGFLDQLKSAVTTTNSTVTAVSALSQDQMVGGLKEALGKGVSNAVVSLGHDGGFLTNLDAEEVSLPSDGKACSRSQMAPAEPRNRKNGVWKLKDDEKNLQQCGGESNPEKQSALAVSKQSNGKSRLKCKFDEAKF